MIKLLLLIVLYVSLHADSVYNDTVAKLFTKKKCDKIYHNNVLTSCYNYKHKGPLYVTFSTKGTDVNRVNIVKRPPWKTSHAIPKRYRVYKKDYEHTNYDIGHLAFDSAFDYSKRTLKNTYLLGFNAVPETPYFNRYYWRKLESYIKHASVLHNEINIIYYIHYNNKKCIGDHVSVPDYIVANLYYDNHIECFKYPNIFKFTKSNNTNNFRIKCKK